MAVKFIEKWDETILLKIHRRYKRDESVAFLLNLIKDLRFKLGELTSELHELRDYKLQPGVRKTKKEWDKDELVADLTQQLKKSQESAKEKNKEINEWRNKYFSLLASSQK